MLAFRSVFSQLSVWLVVISPKAQRLDPVGGRPDPRDFGFRYGKSILQSLTLRKLDLGATMANLPMLLMFAFAGVALFPAKGALAAEVSAGSVRRVLILYENESTLFAVREISRGLYERFNSSKPTSIELYSEYLDTVRFPNALHQDRLSAFIDEKYRNQDIDVVIAIGPGALRFAVDRLSWIPDTTPIVAGAVAKDTIDEINGRSRVYGVHSRFDVKQTVELAARLHPGARQLVVLTGSSDFDRNWRETTRAQLGADYAGLEVHQLTGLSLAEFGKAVSTLPADSLLLILTVFEDAEGRKFVPRDAAAEIVPRASVPAYAVYSSFLGTGIIGGQIETFAGIGDDVGVLVERLLKGSAPSERFANSQVRPVLDWKQIERWKVDPALIPQSAVLRNYEPPVWERYWWQIVAGMAVILLQSATILALVVLEGRRRRISKELAIERLQLAHMSRISQLGLLSGALAHELNQPLTSILTNAEAGLKLLGRCREMPESIREILEDIVKADKHASMSIKGLRQLFMNDEVSCSEVDLNSAVVDTLRLAKTELAARQTSTRFSSSMPELAVQANRSQLQQIVLNLVLNASESMSHLPATKRQIDIETGVLDDGRRILAVSDCGEGMTREMQKAAFKPFVSKRSNGMGLGLPICRSIAEAHGGSLEFDEDREIGVRIILALPAFRR